jgi:hypothetical protein
MFTHWKMALAGTALLACALPAAAQAQGVFVERGYGYAPVYDYGYPAPYGWDNGPFWPIGAAAGLVGSAVNFVASPFVGWRDGYWVDDRIDPVPSPYGWGEALPPYGDVPNRVVYSDGWRGGYAAYPSRGYGGYIARYRGKVPKKPLMHHSAAKPTHHSTHGRVAAR